MALIKEGYIGNFGIPCEYWKIVDIHINLKYKWCEITFDGYSNQTVRMATENYEPLQRHKVRAVWSQEEFGKYFTPYALNEISIYDQAYEYAKQDKFFIDAKDELNHMKRAKTNIDTIKESLPDMKYEGSAHEAGDINQKEKENAPIYPPILDNPDISIPPLKTPGEYDEEEAKKPVVLPEDGDIDV